MKKKTLLVAMGVFLTAILMVGAAQASIVVPTSASYPPCGCGLCGLSCSKWCYCKSESTNTPCWDCPGDPGNPCGF